MEANVSRGKTGRLCRRFRSGTVSPLPRKTRMFDSLIEFIEDSLITRST